MAFLEPCGLLLPIVSLKCTGNVESSGSELYQRIDSLQAELAANSVFKGDKKKPVVLPVRKNGWMIQYALRNRNIHAEGKRLVHYLKTGEVIRKCTVASTAPDQSLKTPEQRVSDLRVAQSLISHSDVRSGENAQSTCSKTFGDRFGHWCAIRGVYSEGESQGNDGPNNSNTLEAQIDDDQFVPPTSHPVVQIPAANGLSKRVEAQISDTQVGPRTSHPVVQTPAANGLSKRDSDLGMSQLMTSHSDVNGVEENAQLTSRGYLKRHANEGLVDESDDQMSDLHLSSSSSSDSDEDNDCEYHKRPELRIDMPKNFQALLVHDQYLIKEENKLAKLPAKITARTIFENYNQENSKSQEMLDSSEGVRQYFEAALGCMLLYNSEKQQFADWKRDNPTGNVCDVYGFVHLLRLFVRFGSILSFTPWAEESLIRFRYQFGHFINFLNTHKRDYYCIYDYYEDATIYEETQKQNYLTLLEAKVLDALDQQRVVDVGPSMISPSDISRSGAEIAHLATEPGEISETNNINESVESQFVDDQVGSPTSLSGVQNPAANGLSKRDLGLSQRMISQSDVKSGEENVHSTREVHANGGHGTVCMSDDSPSIAAKIHDNNVLSQTVESQFVDDQVGSPTSLSGVQNPAANGLCKRDDAQLLIELTTTKGNMMLAENGFHYVYHRSAANGDRLFTCRQRPNCKARIRVNGLVGQQRIVKRTNEHNHGISETNDIKESDQQRVVDVGPSMISPSDISRSGAEIAHLATEPGEISETNDINESDVRIQNSVKTSFESEIQPESVAVPFGGTLATNTCPNDNLLTFLCLHAKKYPHFLDYLDELNEVESVMKLAIQQMTSGDMCHGKELVLDMLIQRQNMQPSDGVYDFAGHEISGLLKELEHVSECTMRLQCQSLFCPDSVQFRTKRTFNLGIIQGDVNTIDLNAAIQNNFYADGGSCSKDFLVEPENDAAWQWNERTDVDTLQIEHYKQCTGLMELRNINFSHPHPWILPVCIECLQTAAQPFDRCMDLSRKLAINNRSYDLAGITLFIPPTTATKIGHFVGILLHKHIWNYYDGLKHSLEPLTPAHAVNRMPKWAIYLLTDLGLSQRMISQSDVKSGEENVHSTREVHANGGHGTVCMSDDSPSIAAKIHDNNVLSQTVESQFVDDQVGSPTSLSGVQNPAANGLCKRDDAQLLIELTTTKGNMMLAENGFHYVYHRSAANGDRLFTCRQRPNCKARIRVNGLVGQQRIVKRTNEHNHGISETNDIKESDQQRVVDVGPSMISPSDISRSGAEIAHLATEPGEISETNDINESDKQPEMEPSVISHLDVNRNGAEILAHLATEPVKSQLVDKHSVETSTEPMFSAYEAFGRVIDHPPPNNLEELFMALWTGEDYISRRVESKRLLDTSRGMGRLFTFPNNLRNLLITDYVRVRQENRLVYLSNKSKQCVDYICQVYSDTKFHPELRQSSEGIRMLFNLSFKYHLLYREEKPMYEQLMETHADNEPSKLYGVIHLLRMFARLSLIVEETQFSPWSTNAIQYLQHHIHDFLAFLELNLQEYIVDDDYYYIYYLEKKSIVTNACFDDK